MADNVDLEAPIGNAAADEISDGTLGTVKVQYVKLMSGAIGAGDKVAGDATNGLDVDVTRLPALVAGSANIGDVDVLTVPADPFGVNGDAASATGSISAKLRFIASTGVSVTNTVNVASHAVTNAGTFAAQVTSISAGDNNIGNVDIVTMPTVTVNSHAVTNAGTFATQATLAAETTKIIGAVNHTTTGLGHGVTTVTTAGTDVVLAGSTAVKWVTLQSQTDNTGMIAVGATGVDATVATGTGALLDAGESITLAIDNLADVFIDSTVSGEGVRYIYGT